MNPTVATLLFLAAAFSHGKADADHGGENLLGLMKIEILQHILLLFLFFLIQSFSRLPARLSIAMLRCIGS